MKKWLVVSVVSLILALSTSVVWADEGNQGDKGGRAPEVPIALIYPAIAIGTYGLFRLVRRA